MLNPTTKKKQFYKIKSNIMVKTHVNYNPK